MIGPVRTCIGCRARAPIGELIRVVVDPASGQPALDPVRAAPGRGAHLHDSDACFDTALRRRAVARALRIGAVDADGWRERWAARPSAATQ